MRFTIPQYHRSPVPCALVLSILCAAPVCAGMEEGHAAHGRGDYETTLKEWRPLAEQGYAQAQYNVGVMYESGQGVARDYREALRWYRLAAVQGHARAQISLGFGYLLATKPAEASGGIG
jgi:uncharacterized protein